MKKVVALILALFMCAVSFTACIESSKNEKETKQVDSLDSNGDVAQVYPSNTDENTQPNVPSDSEENNRTDIPSDTEESNRTDIPSDTGDNMPYKTIDINENVLFVGSGKYSSNMRVSAINQYKDTFKPVIYTESKKDLWVSFSVDYEIKGAYVSLISPVDDNDINIELDGYIDLAAWVNIHEKTVEIDTTWWYRDSKYYPVWSYMFKLTDTENNFYWYYFRVDYSGPPENKLIKVQSTETEDTHFLSEKGTAAVREMLRSGAWIDDGLNCGYNFVLYDEDITVYCNTDVGVFSLNAKSILLTDEERETISKYFDVTVSANVKISSGENSTNTTPCLVDATVYDENFGLAQGCGGGAYYKADGNELIPGLIFDGDLSVELLNNGGILKWIEVYDIDFYDRILLNPTADDIKSLAKGQYYVSVYVVFQEDYIKEYDTYTGSSYDYLCVLEIK